MYNNIYVIDWHSEDVIDEDESDTSEASADSSDNRYKHKYLIRTFGLDSNNNSVALTIKGFNPYFFIQLPEKFSDENLEELVSYAKSKVMPMHRDNLLEAKIIRAKPFHNFCANDKFLFAKLIFTSTESFRKYQYIFTNPIKIRGIKNSSPVTYKLYESNIPPFLRFIHTQDIKASGWIRIHRGNMYEMSGICKQTTCTKEYLVKNWRDIKNFPKDEEPDIIPKIKYCAYDIECDSSHGDFPIAHKNYQKLARDLLTDFRKKYRKIDVIQHRKLLERQLELAFNPYYTNGGIRKVVLLNPEENPINDDEFFKEVAELILKESKVGGSGGFGGLGGSGGLVDYLLQLFEINFPEINTQTSKSDYLNLAESVVSEINRLTTTNNVAFKEHPVEVLSLMLKLAFEPYFDGNDINRVFTKENKLPEISTLHNMVPKIFELCKSSITDKYHKLTSEQQDMIENQLTEFLDQHLPPLLGDPVIQIGTTFKKYGETDCYLKHIICLGKSNEITNDDLVQHENKDVKIPVKDMIKDLIEYYKEGISDDPDAPDAPLPRSTDAKEIEQWITANLEKAGMKEKFNNLTLKHRCNKQRKTDKAEVIVECYDTEEEVLLAWQRLIQKQDPDIIIGYNIFGFDFKHMYGRAVELGVERQFGQLGRIAGFSQLLKEQKLSSSGLGDNIMYYIEMHGRVLIDLYKVVQNSFKMDNYKLDNVCNKFLNKTKNDMPPKELFIKQKGSDDDRREIAEYCIIDCILCVRLLDKLDILINNIGMSQVCSVPLSYLFLRGQGIKLLSFVSKICREKGYLIPLVKKEDHEDQGGYEGAIVLKPSCDIYNEPIAVGDFNSLYPSCMISENLSHDSFVSSKVIPVERCPVGTTINYTDHQGIILNPENKYEKELLDGKYEGWEYRDIIHDVYEEVPIAPGRKKKVKQIVGYKICRFAQPPNGGKSIIPTILMELLKARAETRKLQENYPKGSFKWVVLEGLQLAYKILANSLYGQLGASTSPIAFFDAAASTTAMGRFLITFSKKFIEKNYPGSKVVYGDTDSIFVKFRCVDGDGKPLTGLDAVYKSIMLCCEACCAISRQLRRPHNLAFEKVIKPFALVSKKRYCGKYYTKFGSDDSYINSMGLISKRRDNAKIAKHVFNGLMDIIMTGEPDSITRGVEFVKNECTKLLEGKFSIDMFIVTKTLKSFYKQPDKIAHNVLAQRIGKRDPGNKPQTNDRIAYVYIRNKDPKALQGDRIETPDFVTANKLLIDYRYYLTNQIRKPVSQILYLKISQVKVDAMFDSIIREYDDKLMGVRKLPNSMFTYINVETSRRPKPKTELPKTEEIIWESAGEGESDDGDEEGDEDGDDEDEDGDS